MIKIWVMTFYINTLNYNKNNNIHNTNNTICNINNFNFTKNNNIQNTKNTIFNINTFNSNKIIIFIIQIIIFLIIILLIIIKINIYKTNNNFFNNNNNDKYYYIFFSFFISVGSADSLALGLQPGARVSPQSIRRGRPSTRWREPGVRPGGCGQPHAQAWQPASGVRSPMGVPPTYQVLPRHPMFLGPAAGSFSLRS